MRCRLPPPTTELTSSKQNREGRTGRLVRPFFYAVRVSDLEVYLAEQARRLNLTPLTLGTASPETLHTYCAAVLHELAARGLLEGEREIGCYAAARASGN